jgi:photosystem II stability/assembly factor-like uncharacterized protein
MPSARLLLIAPALVLCLSCSKREGATAPTGVPAHPPYKPVYSLPKNGAVDVDLFPELAWDRGGPDTSVVLDYPVYCDTVSPPLKLIGSGSSDSHRAFVAQNLKGNTTYYWRVDETDGKDTVHGDVWKFTTRRTAAGNNPPIVPFSPLPHDGFVGAESNPSVQWNTGDPDGDPIVCTVLYDTVNPPVQEVGQNSGEYAAQKSGLSPDTWYYWQIVETDGKDTVRGPVWSFKTKAHFNQAPVWATPSESLITTVGKTVTVDLQAADPENDSIVFTVGLIRPGESAKIETNASLLGNHFSWTPADSQTGTYLVVFHAFDNGTPVMESEIKFYISVLPHSNPGDTWVEETTGMRDLRDVRFHDVDTGWMAGKLNIWKTYNGGVYWVPKVGRLDLELNCIRSRDAAHVWACGSKGAILRSSDGGENWIDGNSGTGARLASMSFVDTLRGWAVGDSVILQTSDGGATWHAQDAGAAASWTSVQFLDANTGWVTAAASGGRPLLYTSDGGAHWNAVDSGLAGDFYSVFFQDGGHGWIAGSSGTTSPQGLIGRTRDGGGNWDFKSIPGAGRLYSIHFVDARIGWAAGAAGTLLKTVDGGENWAIVSIASKSDLHAVFGLRADRGWAVGDAGALHRRLTYVGP